MDPATPHVGPKSLRSLAWAGWLSTGLLAGAIVRGFLPPFVLDQPFWRDFLTSAGFGGSMAVVAALVAYAAARQAADTSRRQAEEDRQQRDRQDRKAQWWHRAEWALNQAASRDTDRAEIGQKMLGALSRSEWAEEHEADVIAAATKDALEAVPEDELQRESDSTPAPQSATMERGGSDERRP